TVKVLLPPGLDEQWLISVMHTDEDAMRYADVFGEFVVELTSSAATGPLLGPVSSSGVGRGSASPGWVTTSSGGGHR
ncbi:MAG: hypothetical protein ACPHIW_04350, partial [Ilumatobacteraceae bacterium]